MICEAKKIFKFNDKQIRRIYEILRLSVTDRKNAEEYKIYKAMIKQRLSAPFAVSICVKYTYLNINILPFIFKQQEKLAKRRKLFHNSQVDVDAQEVEHHESLIEKEYNQLIGNYKHVINKHKSHINIQT